MLQSLCNSHVQDLGYIRAFPLDLKSLAIVARTGAHLARDGYVGEELHLNVDVAITRARLASAPLDIEGEPARFITSRASFGNSREQLTDGSERAGVGRRVRARGATDRRLVDIHHLVNVLNAVY